MVKIGSLIVKINKPNSDEDEFKQIEQPTSAMSNWNQSQNDDSSSEILPLLNEQAHFLPRKFGINETQQRVSAENLFDCIILCEAGKIRSQFLEISIPSVPLLIFYNTDHGHFLQM